MSFQCKKWNISETTVSFLQNVEGRLELNVYHDYYYQIQGQLFCSNRKECMLVIYTFKDLKVISVHRDQEFINDMLVKLESFLKHTSRMHCWTNFITTFECQIDKLLTKKKCNSASQLIIFSYTTIQDFITLFMLPIILLNITIIFLSLYELKHARLQFCKEKNMEIRRKKSCLLHVFLCQLAGNRCTLFWPVFTFGIRIYHA